MIRLFGLILLVTLVVCRDYPTLPNVQFLASGYDTKIGQPVIEALRLPVVQLTWNFQKKVYLGSDVYLVPDQVYALSDPAIDKSATSQVYMSTLDVETNLTQSFSMGILAWNQTGMFSMSEQTTTFEFEFYNNTAYTAFSNMRIKCWMAALTPDVNLDPYFQLNLFGLPQTYTGLTPYLPFFAKFGTHSTLQAVYGGSVQMSTSFSQTVYKHTSITQIHEDLHMQFVLMTLNQTLSYEQQTVLDELDQTYSSNFTLVGGQPDSFTPNEWQSWAGTVPDNPIFLQMELIPLWYLYPADRSDQANALAQAIKMYLLS